MMSNANQREIRLAVLGLTHVAGRSADQSALTFIKEARYLEVAGLRDRLVSSLAGHGEPPALRADGRPQAYGEGRSLTKCPHVIWGISSSDGQRPRVGVDVECVGRPGWRDVAAVVAEEGTQSGRVADFDEAEQSAAVFVVLESAWKALDPGEQSNAHFLQLDVDFLHSGNGFATASVSRKGRDLCRVWIARAGGHVFGLALANQDLVSHEPT